MSRPTVPLNMKIDSSLRAEVVRLARDERRTLTATVEILLQEALDARRENGNAARG